MKKYGNNLNKFVLYTNVEFNFAPIVKWYNVTMVRLNFKFDSWWGHQSL